MESFIPMRFIKIVLLASVVIIASCKDSDCKTTSSKSAVVKNERDQTTPEQLSALIKQYEEPSQNFKVSSLKSSQVKGKKGTILKINPSDLITESGKPAGKSIEVELKELTKQGELLRSQASTVSDGKLLVSGGAYFIGFTSDGEKLKLKEGKTLKVQFPKITKKEMALFYGERNETGLMNWKQANQNLTSSPKTETKTDKTIPEAEKGNSDIDDLLSYTDTGAELTTDEKKVIRADKNIAKKIYDEIEIKKLGWINCDRFLDSGEETSLTLELNSKKDSNTISSFLIFKDINSVMQVYFDFEALPKFENIPIGYNVKLISYTYKENKLFAYVKDFKTTKNQELKIELSEMKEADFKKTIKNL